MIALYPLMPDRMTVNRDSNGQLYYEYTVSMDDAPTVKDSLVRLNPSDVLHIPGLGFDGLVGYSPIATAKNAIGNANKIAVLEEGMKYTPIGISPEQAQFNEIARIFWVPPHMVGDLEKSSFSNIEQQSLEFVKYTLEPWLVRWEQSIQRTLFSPEEKKRYFAKFIVDGLGKARTGDTTDEGTYANWYKAVYTPTEDEPEETAGQGGSVRMIKREIEISGKMVPFRSSATIPRLYRAKFKRDIFKDLSKLEKSYKGKSENGEELQIEDLEISKT